jgi:hypothetical protein
MEEERTQTLRKDLVLASQALQLYERQLHELTDHRKSALRSERILDITLTVSETGL